MKTRAIEHCFECVAEMCENTLINRIVPGILYHGIAFHRRALASESIIEVVFESSGGQTGWTALKNP